MTTATNAQRCMEELRERGYKVQKVETWNAFAVRDKVKPWVKGKKIDLFGIIDVLAIREGEILGVQSASNYADMMAHQRMYLADATKRENLISWLRAGGKFQIWGWENKKIEGVRKRWHVKIIELVKEDLHE